MLKCAQKRAADLGMNVTFALMDTENLEFPENSFDTVVSTLSLCTFPNPIRALQEMSRVCRPSGSILLLEHGQSNRRWMEKFLDRIASQWLKSLGCQCNRNHLDLVHAAGLCPVTVERTCWGMVYMIRALPSMTTARE